MVTISFNHKMLTGVPMTRGNSTSIGDGISNSTPTYINVELRNIELGTTYACKSDETIKIPIGTYEIKGENVREGTAIYGGGTRYSFPPIKCNSFTTTIDYSTDSITLNVFYDCYAIVALAEECKEFLIYTTEDGYITHGTFGAYFINYFQNDAKVELIPRDDDTILVPTTFEFSPDPTTDRSYVEYGKYYVVHPQRDNNITSSFDMVLPKMTEGEL